MDAFPPLLLLIVFDVDAYAALLLWSYSLGRMIFPPFLSGFSFGVLRGYGFPFWYYTGFFLCTKVQVVYISPSLYMDIERESSNLEVWPISPIKK